MIALPSSNPARLFNQTVTEKCAFRTRLPRRYIAHRCESNRLFLYSFIFVSIRFFIDSFDVDEYGRRRAL